MRVAFFHYSRLIGGGERVALNVLRFFPLDVEVVGCAPSGPLEQAFRQEGVPVEVLHLVPVPRFPCSLLAHAANLLISAAYLVGVHHRRRLDVVLASGTLAALYAVPGAHLNGVSLVWHHHAIYGQRLAPLVRWLARRCRHVIVDSEAVKANMRDLGAHVGHVVVMHNGVDARHWDASRYDGPAARREIGIPDADFLVVLLCQLHPWKGVQDFVAAAAPVLASRADVSFLIVGAAYYLKGDAFERQIRAEMAAADPTGRRLRMLVQSGRIERWMAASDLVVQPSRDPDPLPTVLLESMAMGKAVVGTDTGGIPEIIADGITGRIVPTRDPEALAKVILELAADRDLCRSYARAGRERARDRFSAEGASSRLVSILRGACGRVGG